MRSRPSGSGGRRPAGIVARVGVTAPDGIVTKPVVAITGAVPETLVELALWLADYYGSTPARALGLVAPVTRKRRGEERPSPALRESLAGEVEPDQLTAAQLAAIERVVDALDRPAAPICCWSGQRGAGRPRSTSRPPRPLSSVGTV